MNGVPGLGGGGITASAVCALAEPAYPDLPHAPVEPATADDAAWEQFNEDYDACWQAWRDFRNEAPGLEEQAGLFSALADFSAESTTLALAGEGNGVYSPISLWFALAMLAETTDGDSRQEILDALGAEDVEQLRSWADSLWHDLYTDDGAASVLLGTSMWLNQGWTSTRTPWISWRSTTTPPPTGPHGHRRGRSGPDRLDGGADPRAHRL